MKEAKMMIRLPIEVRDWFRDYAKQHARSMNGQVVAILQEIKNSNETRKGAGNAEKH